MTTHPVRRWTIGDSPAITLALLGVSCEALKREEMAELLRTTLSKCTDPELQNLAHKVATQRTQKCGEDFGEVYGASLAFYRKECDAVLHPQMG